MTGKELYEVFVEKGGNKLYHANSVMTSISLLKLGGLASRGLVKQKKYPQTRQISDDLDQEYGIWYDSFLDSYDIHKALGTRNFYGPVLFVMDAQLLLNLPPEATVRVTRYNPTKWRNLPENQRYFLTKQELESGFRVGHFDHMITIRSPSGIIPFAGMMQRIIIDEPRLAFPSVGQEYMTAQNAILAEIENLGIDIDVARRNCNWCKCTAEYQKPEYPSRIRYFFTP